jgi:hypothetical protein
LKYYAHIISLPLPVPSSSPLPYADYPLILFSYFTS